jgi:hypothetical protein
MEVGFSSVGSFSALFARRVGEPMDHGYAHRQTQERDARRIRRHLRQPDSVVPTSVEKIGDLRLRGSNRVPVQTACKRLIFSEKMWFRGLATAIICSFGVSQRKEFVRVFPIPVE